MVVYPLYLDGRNGYQDIGNTKYYFFRNVSMLVLAMLFLLLLLDLLQSCRIKTIAGEMNRHYKNLSVTDWFVYGYLVAVLLSYAFTAFKKEALFGADGWYMGLVSQLIFIAVYFLFSRYFVWKDSFLYITLVGSGLVFLLGILNRYSIYPIAVYGQTPTFISTLGNINWFCGYFAVLCPLGIAFYWKSQNRLQRTIAGIYVVIAFITGVTQGSSSGYLALLGVFLFLFALSFRENEDMKRFLEICLLFGISCQMARAMRYLPGFTLNYEKDISILLTDTNLTLYMVVVCGVLYAAFVYCCSHKNLQINRQKWLRFLVLILAAVVLVGSIVLLIGNTCLEKGLFGLKGNSFFTFDRNWANSRGGTWISGALAYKSMSPVKRLIGVGPDCFASYLYAVPELAQRVYEQFGNSRLTNAHNEWLTVLVNTGALGLCCYVGIFLSAIWRFTQKAKLQPMLYLCALCIFSYMMHNAVSFQQILNTPYVFLLLGIGEGFARKAEKVIDK